MTTWIQMTPSFIIPLLFQWMQYSVFPLLVVVQAQESLAVVKGKTGVVYSRQMTHHCCLWDPKYLENPDRLLCIHDRHVVFWTYLPHTLHTPNLSYSNLPNSFQEALHS